MSAENGCLSGFVSLSALHVEQLESEILIKLQTVERAMSGAKQIQLPGLWLHFCHKSWFGGLCGNLPYVYE